MPSKVLNAFTSYDAKANREDLSNSIYNLDPFDTPVVSMAGRRTVKNRTFDWQTENLPTVDIDNARLEGFQLEPRKGIATVRQTNTTQISSRDATVSGTQEASDAAGKSSEMAHQMAMQSKVLKSDIELITCSRQARNQGEDVTPAARRTESFAHQIARARGRDQTSTGGTAGAVGDAVFGVKNGAGTEALPSGSDVVWTGIALVGSRVPFTEKMLGDAMEVAYNNGAEPTKLVVSSAIKRTVSTFVGRSSSQVTVGKTEVVAVVDVIATDFGRITALASRWVPADLGFIIDPEYVAIGFFRTFRQYPIAKVGDAETRMILAEWGVECRNGMAHVLLNGIKQDKVIGSP
jgi:hypothetical protein